MPLELMPHQKIDSAWMFQAKRCINGSDMGTGKSGCAIQAVKYSLKAAKGKRVLIVCPASLKENWKREIGMWWPNAPVTILKGTKAKRQKILCDYQQSEGFLIVNPEQVAAKKSDEGKKAFTEQLLFIGNCGFTAMIVDEAHVCRNRKTMLYKGIDWLASQIEYLYLLTGTPIMNRTEDLWTALHMIDRKKYSSFWAFVDHPVYGVGKEKNEYGGYSIGQKSKNPAALAREIEPFFCRRLKQEVLKDLPSKTYQRIWVELHPNERKVYDEMQKEWLAYLKGGQEVAAPVLISQITRLKQFCISPDLAVMPLVDGREYGHGYKTSKFLALLEILTATDQKIVVFTQFEKAVTLGIDMCQAHGIGAVRHTGKENNTERDRNIERFKNDPDTQVIFLTIQSGGVGLNLVESCVAVFLDLAWTPATNLQASDRIHRKGQANNVTIYELQVKNSVEEWLIMPKLEGKKDLVKEIIKMAEEFIEEKGK